MKKLIWIGGGILVLIGGFFVFQAKPVTPSTDFSTLSNRELAVLCDADMDESFHIHPHLEIVINGEKTIVPADIGVTSTCMTALHTHTPDGVIHVEAPEKRDFTLGDFFAVWNKPFSKTELLEYKSDEGHVVMMTVNGAQSDEYENLVLKDGDVIVLVYQPL